MAKDYNITKTTGHCTVCGREMQPGEEFVATVREAPEEAEEQFVRRDYCLACWPAAPDQEPGDPALLGTWRSQIPQPRGKKRTFVDEDLLVQFFERLEGAAEPVKVQFRFVLALILMRKKRLVYDRSEPRPDGCDAWTMHFRGSDDRCEVIDPHLDEDQIAEVSQQLGEILEGEL
jgi:hypothetical protein